MTTAIDTYVKELGYAVAGCAARYEPDAVVVLMAFSVEAANDFLDKFLSGDQDYADAVDFELKNPEYPIARGTTWQEAFLNLETKIQNYSYLDGDWRHGLEVELSEFLYGAPEE